jgi:aryl-alcohol dehydrogenase-like predicted oxidoreductase
MGLIPNFFYGSPPPGLTARPPGDGRLRHFERGLATLAIAYGLARTGLRVALLDEGDVAFRASRGNFGLNKQLPNNSNAPRAQIALAWLLSKPVISAPIVGATKLHQLDDAIASVNVKLSAEEIAAYWRNLTSRMRWSASSSIMSPPLL